LRKIPAIMDLSRIPLFDAIAKRLSWLGERQSVLAQNVANADTPGYVAKDVKPPDFAKLVTGAGTRLPLLRTDPQHILPVNASGAFEQAADAVKESAPNGNTVQLEDQMMKISSNASDHALTTSLYKKQLALLKIALGQSPTG
jgi:flagellar basal-body rod protein FlgB